jgi:hypothetical protein
VDASLVSHYHRGPRGELRRGGPTSPTRYHQRTTGLCAALMRGRFMVWIVIGQGTSPPKRAADDTHPIPPLKPHTPQPQRPTEAGHAGQTAPAAACPFHHPSPIASQSVRVSTPTEAYTGQWPRIAKNAGSDARLTTPGGWWMFLSFPLLRPLSPRPPCPPCPLASRRILGWVMAVSARGQFEPRTSYPAQPFPLVPSAADRVAHEQALWMIRVKHSTGCLIVRKV